MNDVKRFREKDIERILNYAGVAQDQDKEALARKAMNSFYRLAGFNEWRVAIENDERTYNYYKKQEEALFNRFCKWHARLNEYFKPFGMVVKFYGIYPTLETFEGRNITYGYYYK